MERNRGKLLTDGYLKSRIPLKMLSKVKKRAVEKLEIESGSGHQPLTHS
jgi:ribosomal protein L15